MGLDLSLLLVLDLLSPFSLKDTLLSLDIVGRALVLPQSNVPDFADSPWKVLPSLRSGLGWDVVEER